MSEQSNPENSVTKASQFQPLSSVEHSDIIGSPPVQSRQRGKCMSRRTGQNPKVRVKKCSNGQKVFFFQYWIDVPGQEARKRKTHVIGPISQMTKSEAERKKVEFLLNLELNSMEYLIPSSLTFANAISHYRDVFAPRMLRSSTYSTADGHLRTHLEADWKDVPIEHITLDSVNEWIWKKRDEKAGMQAFRRGCNRRWELAGVNPAVIRQQMGHASAAMTALYTGEIPLEQIRSEFSMKFGNKIDVLETMETGAAA